MTTEELDALVLARLTALPDVASVWRPSAYAGYSPCYHVVVTGSTLAHLGLFDDLIEAHHLHVTVSRQTPQGRDIHTEEIYRRGA